MADSLGNAHQRSDHDKYDSEEPEHLRLIERRECDSRQSAGSNKDQIEPAETHQLSRHPRTNHKTRRPKATNIPTSKVDKAKLDIMSGSNAPVSTPIAPHRTKEQITAVKMRNWLGVMGGLLTVGGLWRFFGITTDERRLTRMGLFAPLQSELCVFNLCFDKWCCLNPHVFFESVDI